MYHYSAMLAKRTYKNQITLPHGVIREFPGVDYFDVSAREGEIVLRPVRIDDSGAALKRVREKIRLLGLTEKDIHEAVRWARTKP
jgi:hypothetical protein